MAETDIYPTFCCFDDCLDNLVELLKDESFRTHELYAVHAICKAPSGEEYAHAWVEDVTSNTAIFSGILKGERLSFGTPIPEYRDHVNVVELTRYTYQEAYKLNLETGHYGPWIEKYRALCGRERKVYAS